MNQRIFYNQKPDIGKAASDQQEAGWQDIVSSLILGRSPSEAFASLLF
jgi:hypothetical protein